MTYPQVNLLDWSTIQPCVDELLAEELTTETVGRWLERWSDLSSVLYEGQARIQRAVAENTADIEAESQFQALVERIIPNARRADQRLRDKLLALSDYAPSDETRELMRRFRAEAGIYRAENVPLLSEVMILENDYAKLTGAMNVDWNGEAETIPKANSRLLSDDRAERERAWRLVMERYLRGRTSLNDLYLDRRQAGPGVRAPMGRRSRPVRHASAAVPRHVRARGWRGAHIPAGGSTWSLDEFSEPLDRRSPSR